MRRSQCPSALGSKAAPLGLTRVTMSASAPPVGLAAVAAPTAGLKVPTAAPAEAAVAARYFSVLWCKQSTKKHKTYDDGVLALTGKLAVLYDLEGKVTAKEFSRLDADSLRAGSTLCVGRNDVEVVNAVCKEHFESGRIFSTAPSAAGAVRPPAAASSSASSSSAAGSLTSSAACSTAVSSSAAAAGSGCAGVGGGAAAAASLPIARRGSVGLAPRQPLLGGGLQPKFGSGAGGSGGSGAGDGTAGAGAAARALPRAAGGLLAGRSTDSTAAAGAAAAAGVLRAAAGPRPRHDPAAPNALVLFSPPPPPHPGSSAAAAAAAGAGAAAASTAPAAFQQPSQQQQAQVQVAVVVDPVLTQHLRPHQRQGVRFLWECVEGRREGMPPGLRGCILADEMGLGKTVQTIALTWTLLKQSPTPGAAAASKAIVVCPSSLVDNWRAEFKRWLGDERCRPLAVRGTGAEAAAQIADFMAGSAGVHPVLIVSYEMLRKHVDLVVGSPGAARVGLLVCDEGHRLKASAGNKTIDALNRLPTKRRVILSGTPVQNNLEELYAMASFVNPGLLGPLPVFKRVFQQPIAAGRDRGATPAEARLAEQRSGELARQLSLFVLRRTSDVNHAYLPPKTEALVFLRLAPLQAALYRAIAASRDAQRCVTGGGAGGAGRSGSGGGGSGGDAAVLRTLNALRKVCMHPDLLLPKAPGQGKGGMAGGRGRKGAAAFPASQLTLAAGAVGQKRKRVAVGGAYAAAAAAGAAGRAPKRKPAAAAGTAASLLLASSDEEGEEEAAPEGSDGGDADAYGEGSEEDEDDDGVLDVVADEEDEDEELDGASDVSAGSRPRASAGGGGGLVPGDPSEDPLADCLRLLPAGYTRLSAIPLLAGGAGATAPASGAAAAAAAGYGGLLGARGAAAFLGASSPQQQPPPLSAFELALSHSSKLQFVDRLLRHVRGGRSSSSGGSIAGLDANAGAGGGSAGSGSSGAGFCGSASGTSSGAGASVSSSGASGSAGSEDKVVLVSNYTQVLDLCAALCAHRGWPSVRLDGSTPAAARSDIVAAFNRPGSAAFVFLLSSQAGGVGLNLVSANRLVLLDSAWNPALDRQALARVWRDGQRKHTYIYRLFAAHSMEEKILQRQLLKEGVASALGQGGGSGGDGGAGGGEGVGAGGAGGKGGKGGGEGSSVTFSRAELRELFTMNPDTPAAVAPCDTYRVMRASYSHAAAAAAAASAARAKVPAAGTSGGGRASGDRAVSDDDGDGDSEPDAEAEGSSCGGSRGGSAGGSAGESSDSSGGAAWWAPWRGAASVAEDVALYASLAVPARRADATEALHTSSAALSSAALGNADEGAGVVSGSGGGELATYVKLYRVNHKTVPPAAASSGRVAGSTGAAEATASSSVTGGVARPAAGGGYRSALQQLEEWECELQLEEGDGEGAAALPAGGACSGVRANATRCGVAVDDDEGAEGVAED